MAENLSSDLKLEPEFYCDTKNGSVLDLKKCCVCMRKDTKLLHLCLVNGGGNSMFSILCDIKEESLAYDSEPTRLIICLECDSVLSKIVRFRQQAYRAQKRLSSIAEGRTMAQNTFVIIPPMSSARNSGPDAIFEYRSQNHAEPAQPLLRVVRYVLPDGPASSLSPSSEGVPQSSLQELLGGIQQ